MRATTIGMILATDLSQNFPTINAFKAMLTDYKTEAADSGSPGPSAPPPTPGGTRKPSMEKKASKIVHIRVVVDGRRAERARGGRARRSAASARARALQYELANMTPAGC